MSRRQGKQQEGFTLIEVLVAILIVSIGVLGFAKMQALALSSTKTASSRSIVAMQASGLAAAMQGNRSFWADGAAPINVTIDGASVTDKRGVLNAAVASCAASARPATALCSPARLAAFDVQQWAANLANLLPGSVAALGCTAGAPVQCVLTIGWTERYVSATGRASEAKADTAATAGDRSFTLHIEP